MFRRTPWGLGVIALVCSSSALATLVESQSIEELTRAAPVIVHGRVGPTQAQWDDERRRINTYAEVAVIEALKGKVAAQVLVRQPGGEVGPVGQHVSGAARFKEGEEVLLFLDRVPDEAGVFTVVTLAAGKVAFETTALGEVRAVRHLEGLAFYHHAPGTRPQIRAVNRDDLGTPGQLLSRVKAAVLGKAEGAR